MRLPRLDQQPAQVSLFSAERRARYARSLLSRAFVDGKLPLLSVRGVAQARADTRRIR
jgi:hypothetical protein